MFKKRQAGKWTGRIAVLILALPLVACDTASEKAHFVTSKPLNANSKDEKTVDAAFSAALTPLEDMGLRKRDIPTLLQKLAENPYFPPPKPVKCEGVKQEMADLTVLLGPDIDTPQVALSANQQYAEKGAEMVHDALVGLVRSQTSVIPFRSIVRRITGAESHEKQVARAIESGKLRRAYLRGLAHAKFGDSCLPAPQVITAQVQTELASKDVELAHK